MTRKLCICKWNSVWIYVFSFKTSNYCSFIDRFSFHIDMKSVHSRKWRKCKILSWRLKWFKLRWIPYKNPFNRINTLCIRAKYKLKPTWLCFEYQISWILFLVLCNLWDICHHWLHIHISLRERIDHKSPKNCQNTRKSIHLYFFEFVCLIARKEIFCGFFCFHTWKKIRNRYTVPIHYTHFCIFCQIICHFVYTFLYFFWFLYPVVPLWYCFTTIWRLRVIWLLFWWEVLFFWHSEACLHQYFFFSKKYTTEVMWVFLLWIRVFDRAYFWRLGLL